MRTNGRTLGMWLASRVAVAVLWVVGAFELGHGSLGSMPPLLHRWRHWDADIYIKIAQYGYLGAEHRFDQSGLVAFFPGEPIALRLAHFVIPNWVADGLLVSFVAGAVAAVSLARLGSFSYGADVGDRAALYLVLSPFAVFLFAGYSEALFLAFGVSAWLAMRQGRYAVAGILGFFAGGVRITGVFLGVALIVAALAESSGRRPWRRAAWLCGPFLGTAAYFGYLRWLTGSWTAWFDAESGSQWARGWTAPWTALHTTWGAGLDPTQSTSAALSFRAEIVAAAVGVVATVALLVLRRWSEAVYVGLQVIALTTTSYYLSIGRASLLWFPLWLLVARAADRWPRVHLAYLALAPPLMAIYVLGFNSGAWAG